MKSLKKITMLMVVVFATSYALAGPGTGTKSKSGTFNSGTSSSPGGLPTNQTDTIPEPQSDANNPTPERATPEPKDEGVKDRAEAPHRTTKPNALATKQLTLLNANPEYNTKLVQFAKQSGAVNPKIENNVLQFTGSTFNQDKFSKLVAGAYPEISISNTPTTSTTN